MPKSNPAWPYDADQRDPLTKLRIPVTSAHPKLRYIATLDRDSEARPTDLEAAQLASYIEQYKVQFFGADGWYKRKLEEKPFDIDAVTRIFHKWGPDDWSYRIDTWVRGRYWLPVAPALRDREPDDLRSAMTLERTMDYDKGMHTEYPNKAWADWKTERPEIFPA